MNFESFEYIKSKKEFKQIAKLLEEIKSGERDYCDECIGTDYGERSNNSYEYSCEGSFCGETKEELIDVYEDELNEIKKEKSKTLKKYIVRGMFIGLVGFGIYKGVTK